MAISEEMASDFQSLISSLTPEQFRRMLERSMKAANAASLTVVKEVVKKDDGFDVEYVMRFHQATDSEYFLQPDETP